LYAKTYCISRPAQNTGMETPIRENVIKPRSIKVFCLTAAMMPEGMPISQATMAALRVSFTV